MKNIIVLYAFTLLVLSQSTIAAEIDAEKKALIDKILEQTGQSASTVGRQFSNFFIQQLTSALKKSNPEINPKAFDIIKEEVTGIIDDDMVKNNNFSKIMYPIYDKYFTTEDLTKVIELNNTPFGKKMIKVMPLITQEGLQAGQKYGQALGPKIQQRIITRFEKEGIKIKK